MSVLTYNPKEVTVTVNGRIMTGFADGTMVTVSRNEDMWTTQIGVDGEGTRSKSNNKSGRISFSLMQSSDSNRVMSALALLDEVSSSGAVPVQVKDNSGSSLFLAEQAWVVKMPDSEFTREAGPREWIMETDVLIMNLGGN